MHARLRTARRFGVSILDQAQEPASRHFAGQTVAGFAPAFGELAGVPVLAYAAVVIAARIRHRYGCGDHTLYVGEVQKLAVNDPAAPLSSTPEVRMLQIPTEPEDGPAQPYPSFF